MRLSGSFEGCAVRGPEAVSKTPLQWWGDDPIECRSAWEALEIALTGGHNGA